LIFAPRTNFVGSHYRKCRFKKIPLVWKLSSANMFKDFFILTREVFYLMLFIVIFDVNTQYAIFLWPDIIYWSGLIHWPDIIYWSGLIHWPDITYWSGFIYYCGYILRFEMYLVNGWPTSVCHFFSFSVMIGVEKKQRKCRFKKIPLVWKLPSANTFKDLFILTREVFLSNVIYCYIWCKYPICNFSI
jgi:hypothetical protein